MENRFNLITTRTSDNDLPLILQDIGHQQCAGGYGYGPCTRNYYLIHYILNGHGTYHVGGHSYALGPGDGFLIAPFVPAYYVADEEDPWEYCWAGFSGWMAAVTAEKIHFTKDGVLFHNPNTKALAEIFGQTLEQYEQRYNQTANLGWLYLLLAEISRPDPGRNEAYDRMLHHIERNFMHPIDMEQLRHVSNLSYSQVYRLFLQYTNQSPQQYILNYRLSRAQELLSGTEMSITDISSACGFSGTAYFSKAFRQKIGCKPSEFRKYAKINANYGAVVTVEQTENE